MKYLGSTTEVNPGWSPMHLEVETYEPSLTNAHMVLSCFSVPMVLHRQRKVNLKQSKELFLAIQIKVSVKDFSVLLTFKILFIQKDGLSHLQGVGKTQYLLDG